MFSIANALRTHTWLALRSCRGHARLVGRVPQPAPRFTNVTSLSIPRLLSTSSPIRFPFRPDKTDRGVLPPSGSEVSNLLFVANFPYTLGVHELRKRFEVYGPIAEINIGKLGPVSSLSNPRLITLVIQRKLVTAKVAAMDRYYTSMQATPQPPCDR